MELAVEEAGNEPVLTFPLRPVISDTYYKKKKKKKTKYKI